MIKVEYDGIILPMQHCNHNQLNWTDGGYWIGQGTAPKCRLEETISNSISHTIMFPTDESALKWNLAWEKFIRYSGHGGTAGLTAAVTIALGGVPGAILGTVAAMSYSQIWCTEYQAAS